MIKYQVTIFKNGKTKIHKYDNIKSIFKNNIISIEKNLIVILS